MSKEIDDFKRELREQLLKKIEAQRQTPTKGMTDMEYFKKSGMNGGLAAAARIIGELLK